MAFLPVAINVEGRRIVIVGGGRLAAQKLASLCRYTMDITVCAPDICPDARRFAVAFLERPYGEDVLPGAFLVYACTDDRQLNRRIGEDARRRGVLVNVADDPRVCDFVSPAIYKKDHMSVAVTSNAQDVNRAVAWRDRIRKVLEDDPLDREGPPHTA